jgi:hypothetical protein
LKAGATNTEMIGSLRDGGLRTKGGAVGGAVKAFFALIIAKKQGAAGITTAAPRIAGQWGRGDNRLPE